MDANQYLYLAVQLLPWWRVSRWWRRPGSICARASCFLHLLTCRGQMAMPIS